MDMMHFWFMTMSAIAQQDTREIQHGYKVKTPMQNIVHHVVICADIVGLILQML
jgi:hypothetical protein